MGLRQPDHDGSAGESCVKPMWSRILSRNPAPSRNDLAGATIMVVEDDFYQASEIGKALEEAGATVLGPHGTEFAALQRIAFQSPSCAVVDINLGDGALFGVSNALRDKGVPLLFVTGANLDSIPDDLAHVPVLRKPVTKEQIVEAAARLLGTTTP
jgi:CheY-like chemotaxis protein